MEHGVFGAHDLVVLMPTDIPAVLFGIRATYGWVHRWLLAVAGPGFCINHLEHGSGLAASARMIIGFFFSFVVNYRCLCQAVCEDAIPIGSVINVFARIIFWILIYVRRVIRKDFGPGSSCATRTLLRGVHAFTTDLGTEGLYLAVLTVALSIPDFAELIPDAIEEIFWGIDGHSIAGTRGFFDRQICEGCTEFW